MFNLFKTKTKPSSIVDTVEQNTSSYPKEVQEIHKEFETASEKLLAEAMTYIKDAESINKTKVNRLNKLGFSQVKQLRDSVEILKREEIGLKLYSLVEYYKTNYPNNKFITDDQVKKICHKYNLVFGNVSRFKGFVPEKNLLEIESFKLKKEDIGLYCSNDLYFYGRDRDNLFGFKDTNTGRFYIEEGLKICAPVKDMDISGLKLTEGYKLSKQHIPDPVVLQPVDGGYLILTAWGDEANDPIITDK